MKKVTYRKECTIRLVGAGGVEVTIPKLVVDRAAREESQTLQEFVKTHKLVHLFNGFTDFDAAYRFERIKATEVINIGGDEEKELRQPKEGKNKVHGFDELKKRIRR